MRQFWSVASVVFLAVLLPGILRQVNKVTRTMAGAEGRLAAINVETDRILGKVMGPFVKEGITLEEKEIIPEGIKYLAIKYGPGKIVLLPKEMSTAYLAAMGSELLNVGFLGKTEVQNEVTRLFTNLGAQRLQITGEGSWVFATAAKKKNTYQVIMANYDPKNSHSEVVPVNFINLETGKFEFRKTFLGSVMTTENFSTDAGTVQKMIPMQANSVVFLELEAK